jgi:hypothetical protein
MPLAAAWTCNSSNASCLRNKFARGHLTARAAIARMDELSSPTAAIDITNAARWVLKRCLGWFHFAFLSYPALKSFTADHIAQ